MKTRDEMLTALATGICRVKFTKKDGDTRDMTCTRQLDRIPETQRPKGDPTKVPSESIPVFDMNKREWRSFVVANVIAFEGGK